MPAPDASGFVESDGAQIYYATFGTGAPVILLHGGMGNGDHWSHQVPALVASKLQVIAIDSRGQGRSTRTKKPPSYDAMARDVIAVMDHLKLARASIVGWSDGGAVALKLAIHHADRVDRLVVLGAHYDEKGSKKRAGKSPTFAAYGKRCREDYRRLSKTPKQFDHHVRWLSPVWKQPMGFTKDQLRSIRAPALVAVGEHDEIVVVAQVEEMATLIPNARLHVFEATSHFSHWQAPAAFNNVLVGFLMASSRK